MAPACRTCIVDPGRGIDQHTWLVDSLARALRTASRDACFKKIAKEVAQGFESRFDPSVLGIITKNGKFVRYETSEERRERCRDRPK
ncbi:uncharacterized protein B0H18DRAFT_1103397, partial [Fomitopsis serialis]|uniref:uncharacterized protein n=1 Tax=Fomitopsis serialis TaxID=139415 RepID=UPI0020074B4A